MSTMTEGVYSYKKGWASTSDLPIVEHEQVGFHLYPVKKGNGLSFKKGCYPYQTTDEEWLNEIRRYGIQTALQAEQFVVRLLRKYEFEEDVTIAQVKGCGPNGWVRAVARVWPHDSSDGKGNYWEEYMIINYDRVIVPKDLFNWFEVDRGTTSLEKALMTLKNRDEAIAVAKAIVEADRHIDSQVVEPYNPRPRL